MLKNIKKMSRTFRKPSHRLFSTDKKVKDGTVTRVAHSCTNHGGCPYCLSNRTYKNIKKIINIDKILKDEEN